MSDPKGEHFPGEPEPQPALQHDRLTELGSDEEAPRLPFPVVGVGASAGGLEAFFELFDAMPSDPGMAFVLIQHLAPERESLLADILAKRTRMPVHTAIEGMPVERDNLYVVGPGSSLTICEGKLRIARLPSGPTHGRPVDDFFRSLAAEQRERAICVLLSGMGSDGTAGAHVIKAVGGLCIAQDPDSAGFASMPQAAIDQGDADYVLRPSDMPALLQRYAKHPYASIGIGSAVSDLRHGTHIREILTLLRTRVKQDFSGYKRPTILRRIERRMGVNLVTDVDAYVKTLRQNPSEASALADDLLIHVTGFFRDAEAWEALGRNVIAPLVAERDTGAPIRCWVTACSSGEEAYSLAMLVVEEMNRAGKHFEVKIFATDMARRSLDHARAGVYPSGIESEVSPERLERFFEKHDGVYRVNAELRALVIFAPQNILQDPPFSTLDICCCRNLLIYLEPETQSRVLSLLHFGLREQGVLFLGSSETTAAADEYFEAVDKRWRIFRRIGPTRVSALGFGHASTRPPEVAIAKHGRPLARDSIAHITNRALLELHTPAAATVDRDRRVVYFHGDTEKYLLQPRGEPTRDIMKLARENVREALRLSLNNAIAHRAPFTVAGGEVESEIGVMRLYVSAGPMQGAGADGHYLVTFEQRAEGSRRPGDAAGLLGSEGAGPGAELAWARNELQRVAAELQINNEELRASNEEVTSVNEELQSSNEELETSKEELQSLNEELTTVNAQLQAKLSEHEAVTNDLSSLLSSTDIAVIILDTSFRIRRYTPAVKALLELIPADVGRPLADLALKFSDPRLLADAAKVLETLIPLEMEITSAAGRWYVRRLLPYRTTDNRIDGVVVTFVDVTARKGVELALAEKVRLLDMSNDAVIVRDVKNRVIYWNQGAAARFGWLAEEALGKDFQALLKTELEMPLDHLIEQLEQCERLAGEVIQYARDGKRIVSLCRWALDRDSEGRPTAILTSTNDITEAKGAAEALRDREEQLRLLVDGARDFALLLLDAEGRIARWNIGAERLLGFTQHEAVGQHCEIIFTPEDRAVNAADAELARAAKNGRAEDTRWHIRKDGSRFFADGVTTALRGPGGALRAFVKVMRDKTVGKLAEEALLVAAARAEESNRIKDEFLASLSHELRTPLAAISLWAHVLRGSGGDAGDRAKAVDAIEKSAHAQSQLIDDLLDTARITSGTMRVEMVEAQLAPLVTTWVEAAAPNAQGKGLELSLDVAHDVGSLCTDPDRLRQIVWNLVDNAIKFTPSGGKVSVTLKRGDKFVELCVTDTGKGLEPEFIPHVFEPFRQADSSRSRTHGGLGLGLAIAKKLVELLDGKICAQSKGLGKGTAFTVCLPVELPVVRKVSSGRVESAVAHESPCDLRNVDVLLVEDTDETRRALELVFERAGASVTSVASAEAAFEAFVASPPDVIVSDIAMPDGDGYGLLRKVRDYEATSRPELGRTPALALSALARSEDVTQSALAGFDRHVEKPVDVRELLAVVSTLLRTNSS